MFLAFLNLTSRRHHTHSSQNWSRYFVDADDVYRTFVIGCALSGPDGCPISTQADQSPAEVDDIVQAVLKAAHDAAFANSSAPLPSGLIRGTAVFVFRMHLGGGLICGVRVSHEGIIFEYMDFPSIWATVSQAWPEIVAIVAAEASSWNTTSSLTGRSQTFTPDL